MYRMRSFILAYAISVAFVQTQSSTERQVVPTAYRLKINASDLAASDTFSGAVSLNLTLANSMSSLLLHSDNLTLNESSLLVMKKKYLGDRWDVIAIRNLSVAPTFLNISFPSPLASGDYSLYIEYQGYYQTSMVGFAKVGYLFNGEQKFLGVTGFEPTNARKVFPCFDEPGFRTTLSLEIIVDRPLIVVSSIIATSVHNTSETARVFSFHYPAMPLYQLAWAVLDQRQYPATEENSTSTIIHTRAPYLYSNQTIWANQLTARLVQAVGNYTGISFNELTKQSSAKIEQVVLPDFFVGTSEGFGFMSFSEESILVLPRKSSTKYIQDVTLTLARGIVRQWFGGIVSMDSWDNIWLMKGLNHYLQYEIAQSLTEMLNWELGDQVMLELTQQALALDSPLSHPLKVITNTEAELITSISHHLTMYKAGAIIRMLKDVFKTSFQEAMSTFIRVSYSNSKLNPTTPSNIWNILYEVATEDNVDLAHQSLEDVMQQWITSPGYPVLSVTYNSSHFVISQNVTSMWWVPVTYSLQGSSNTLQMWLKPGSSFAVEASNSKWILVNSNQTGFYRVNYTSSLWEIFSRQLSTDHTLLPRLSRAQLIDDAFFFDPYMTLELTGFLRSETDYFPWATALRHYQALIYSMAGHSSYKLLQRYVLNLMSGVIADVGFTSRPQDTHIDKLKRSLVLEKACQFGHQSCIERAVMNLRTWMAQTFYDADLSPALLCAGVANSSREVWMNVWSMFQYSVIPSVRLQLLKSLTCTRSKELLYQFLNNITSTSKQTVTVKDRTTLLETLSYKPFGANVLLNWLVDKLKAQASIYPSETSTASPSSTTPKTGNNTNTTNLTTEQEEGSLVSNISSVAANKTDALSDYDVETILNLITPMLTTIEVGTTLDSFLALGNKTGLSNATLEIMKIAVQRIYMQADQAMTHNAKLTSWLEKEVATTTTLGPTKPPTQSPGTSPPTDTTGRATPSRIPYTLLTFLLPMFLPVLLIV